MSKHTLGPWTAMDTGNVLDRHGNRVARYQDSHFLSEKEMEANGKLIAAAPEMLEALRTVVRHLHAPGGDGYEELLAAERAIAKAEGK